MKQFMSRIAIILFLFIACKKDKKQTLAKVTTTAVSSVTSTGVQTGGNITDDGGSEITYRGVCWAAHSNPTLSDSVTHDGAGNGSFTSTLTNLRPNATYYVKAYAINASGTAYGSEISFTTSQGMPAITTNAVTDIVPLGAKSGGIISSDGGAAVTARGIVWGTSPNPTLSNFKTTDGTGAGSFTSTMSALASQTVYYVRAYATNSFGTAYGNQVQFTSASANTVTDLEGHIYQYVTLCGKSWMAESLRSTKYRNGDPIVNGSTGFDWANSTTGAYVYPNGEVNKVDSFGLLYNVFAVNDARGICPTGWHVPSDDEWKVLEICQGMTQAEADMEGFRGTIADKLREGGSSGLNLRLGGYVFTDGSYQNLYTRGFFWSSTQVPSSGNWFRAVTDATSSNAALVRRLANVYGSSVRCVKD
jgi:uncharacterized protein (TIGR02145 family)